MSKGAATTMNSIILIILLAGMLALYIKMVNDSIDKEMEISLKKAEILKTKNTFYLLNRSLETTWFISTVQTIFKTGENFPASLCQGDLKENIEAYMKKMMEDDYIRIPGYGSAVKINSVDITMVRITPDIKVEDDKIISDVQETITADYAATEIMSDTLHENVISTSFKKMAEYACSAVGLIPDINNYIASLDYDPGNEEGYLSDIENYINSRLDDLFSSLVDIGFNRVKNRLAISSSVLYYDFTAEFSETARYYYHDEINNRFEKKPFSIRVKIEGQVPVKTPV